MLETKADVGFAFDGDADRVIVVDEKGVVRDGDYILALFAKEMKSNEQLNGNAIVATSMSNGGLKLFCNENGIEFLETQVGDKYVLEALLDNDFSFRREQSGHIIRRDFSDWGDGTLNALLVSRILNELRINNSGFKVSEAFDLFIPLVQKHSKVPASHKAMASDNREIIEATEKELAILGNESRIIIRPSGTEPVVRITVEGKLESEVVNSMERLEKIVESVCN